jgi:hypothetical protein
MVPAVYFYLIWKSDPKKKTGEGGDFPIAALRQTAALQGKSTADKRVKTDGQLKRYQAVVRLQ